MNEWTFISRHGEQLYRRVQVLVQDKINIETRQDRYCSVSGSTEPGYSTILRTCDTKVSCQIIIDKCAADLVVASNLTKDLCKMSQFTELDQVQPRHVWYPLLGLRLNSIQIQSSASCLISTRVLLCFIKISVKFHKKYPFLNNKRKLHKSISWIL